jgi:hypothetical protein
MSCHLDKPHDKYADFRSLLTRAPSAAEKDFYLREMGDSEENFRVFLDIALYEKDPLAWRAGWFLDSIDEENPHLASGSVSKIVRALPRIDSSGTLRCLLRLLSRHHIEERDQGLLIDLCFGYLSSELFPVAVKVHAMEIIYNHVLIYPELKEELVTLIRDQVDNNSVAFLARGRKIIKKLEDAG